MKYPRRKRLLFFPGDLQSVPPVCIHGLIQKSSLRCVGCYTTDKLWAQIISLSTLSEKYRFYSTFSKIQKSGKVFQKEIVLIQLMSLWHYLFIFYGEKKDLQFMFGSTSQVTGDRFFSQQFRVMAQVPKTIIIRTDLDIENFSKKKASLLPPKSLSAPSPPLAEHWIGTSFISVRVVIVQKRRKVPLKTLSRDSVIFSSKIIGSTFSSIVWNSKVISRTRLFDQKIIAFDSCRYLFSVGLPKNGIHLTFMGVSCQLSQKLLL